MKADHVRNKKHGIFVLIGGALSPISSPLPPFLKRNPSLSLSLDCIEPGSGMNPAEAAEEAPSDPDTDAFYKTGREKTPIK